MSDTTPATSAPSTALKVMAVIALIFGIMTVFSGGSVLFGPVEVQQSAGAFVPFVVWFNFLAGFAYIAAAILIWIGHGCALRLSALIATATALIAIVFGITAMQGGAFEMRTVAALVLRFGIWAAITLMLLRKKRVTLSE